ncbi:ammonia-dependent NAD(+) synthetase [Pistricoccus aurantiacus]|uniref:NH(3)-dependent NAD(+) synthetase n=1 Tax=Pistricoccus aurantiacus TaxID=1883414 RepID=A0A5B8SN61_9GAMM|nr:ammonia-dependent NAD(+) synthetase [Pistricoccus aurantiacus]QEA38136.1 ammonia-dependent NAD(+) synthetase [Pistricoccus aurantiacus]
MTSQDNRDLQQRIGQALGVLNSFDSEREIERRVDFLCKQMIESGQRGLVLGISGGVDSTVAGRLAQLAVERVREQGDKATFYAMRLPYGEQQDEKDARMAIDYIAPDRALATDIKPASDAMLEALEQSGLQFDDPGHRDFVHGNIKARQRMIAQYAVAGTNGALVVGTDQAAEAMMGFFTKYGDGACDLVPLAGLTKGQVRELGRALGAPSQLVEKVPTADLESLRPQLTDEEALGVSYEEIDTFLMGGEVSEQAYRTIVSTYERTEHKRRLPRSPLD